MKRPDPALARGLHWPAGRERTRYRKRATFKCTFGRARDDLVAELERLGARYPVLSTNLELRLDGLPSGSGPEPRDPGVAVYFLYAGEQHCLACDRWDRVRDNIRAIAKSIEAFRGLKRWGAGDMLKRAMSAFRALPPTESDWRAVLGIEHHHPTLAMVRVRYLELAAEAHPDRGGSTHAMQRINLAWEAAQRELG